MSWLKAAFLVVGLACAACRSPSAPPPDSGKVVAKRICDEVNPHPGVCFQLDVVYPAGEESEFFQLYVDRDFYHATNVGTWLRRLEDRGLWTHDVEGDERP